MNCIFASNARCEPSLVCGDCPNNKKTIVEHDYKCSYSNPLIYVYEDAEQIATFEVVGIFKKHLKLFRMDRLIKDIGNTSKYANLYFKAIKHLI